MDLASHKYTKLLAQGRHFSSDEAEIALGSQDSAASQDAFRRRRRARTARSTRPPTEHQQRVARREQWGHRTRLVRVRRRGRLDGVRQSAVAQDADRDGRGQGRIARGRTDLARRQAQEGPEDGARRAGTVPCGVLRVRAREGVTAGAATLQVRAASYVESEPLHVRVASCLLQ